MIDSDLVITGEGFLDSTSFDGKVISGICRYAHTFSVPVFVIAGGISPEIVGKVDGVSLVEAFGKERAFSETELCIERTVIEHMDSLSR